MRLRSIAEATTEWVGRITPILGSGDPYTLNYGTGSPGRPPMLYVPMPIGWLRRAVKDVNAGRIQLHGEIGKVTHVGEAHVTVSMGPELTKIGEKDLVDSGLFDRYTGDGVPVEVSHTGRFVVLRAAFYRDEADPDGPPLVAEVVEVPALKEIRTSLGLTPLPQIPGISNYIPHVTVGYAPNLNKIHSSYLSKNRQAIGKSSL